MENSYAHVSLFLLTFLRSPYRRRGICRHRHAPQPASPPAEVNITLVGRAADLGNELVNFGLPLPPGFLSDAAMVRVYAERRRRNRGGGAIARAVAHRWQGRHDPFAADSVSRRLPTDIPGSRSRSPSASAARKLQRSSCRWPDTLIDPEGLKGPRVLA